MFINFFFSNQPPKNLKSFKNCPGAYYIEYGNHCHGNAGINHV